MAMATEHICWALGRLASPQAAAGEAPRHKTEGIAGEVPNLSRFLFNLQRH
jgi:hypothetical protein